MSEHQAGYSDSTALWLNSLSQRNRITSDLASLRVAQAVVDPHLRLSGTPALVNYLLPTLRLQQSRITPYRSTKVLINRTHLKAGKSKYSTEVSDNGRTDTQREKRKAARGQLSSSLPDNKDSVEPLYTTRAFPLGRINKTFPCHLKDSC